MSTPKSQAPLAMNDGEKIIDGGGWATQWAASVITRPIKFVISIRGNLTVGKISRELRETCDLLLPSRLCCFSRPSRRTRRVSYPSSNLMSANQVISFRWPRRRNPPCSIGVEDAVLQRSVTSLRLYWLERKFHACITSTESGRCCVRQAKSDAKFVCGP